MPKRIKFFIVHLTLSLLLVLIIVGFILFFWYPSPLSSAVGVTQIIVMLSLIDVILGPLLGLLVYKEGKKSLNFDLSIIIFIQVFALCYGIYTIEQGRPVWLVYNVDRLEVIRKNELIEDNIENAPKQFQQPSWFKPQFVGAEFAHDKKQRSDDMFIEVFSGISIAQKPERYVDLQEVKTKMQQKALTLNELEKYNLQQDVKRLLSKNPKANAWLPLKASAVDMVVLINKESAEVIKIVDLRPWS